MPKDERPIYLIAATCPCCGGELQLTRAQRAGDEPVDCPNPICGFNEARVWDLAPAPPAEPPKK